ncbi:hypothetical protein C8F01DRAFT_1256105 [Mycena amicta]|nr:hypothetical protein C8F01DRAFT_1256105 [Mycena amicta]
MLTPEFTALLAARDTRCEVDNDRKTARLPGIRPVRFTMTSASHVAFCALYTLRALAGANDESLWDIYGDVISRWTASAPASTMAEKIEDSKHWVTEYRNNHPVSETDLTLDKIRRCLCTVDLVYVPFEAVYTLAAELSTDTSALHKAIACHHRTDQHKNTIFLTYFLVRLEILVQQGYLAPNTAVQEGYEMDVLVVSMAKAIIHESRHLVGTLLHGPDYRTPYLVQGAFPEELNDFADGTGEAGDVGEADAGKAGDWFEAARYGAYALPTLVSSTDQATYKTTSVRLTGRLEGLPRLRHLIPSVVATQAARVRNGRFHEAADFFQKDSTAAEHDYQVSLGDLDPAFLFAESPSSPSTLRQSKQRSTSQVKSASANQPRPLPQPRHS